MGHRFADLAFTDRVKAAQVAQGSRASYARLEGGAAHHDRLGPAEAAFLAARDSLYMATVSETGWPYVQHRGGPPGFLKVLDERTIGFADFRGNRQYVSVGNLAGDDRVSLILVDYPAPAPAQDPGAGAGGNGGRGAGGAGAARAAGLPRQGRAGPVDRGRGVRLELPAASDATLHRGEIAVAVAPLHARIAELEAALDGR